MMIDAPGYDFDKEDDETEGKSGKGKKEKVNKVKLTSENVNDVINLFNSLPR